MYIHSPGEDLHKKNPIIISEWDLSAMKSMSSMPLLLTHVHCKRTCVCTKWICVTGTVRGFYIVHVSAVLCLHLLL